MVRDLPNLILIPRYLWNPLWVAGDEEVGCEVALPTFDVVLLSPYMEGLSA